MRKSGGNAWTVAAGPNPINVGAFYHGGRQRIAKNQKAGRSEDARPVTGGFLCMLLLLEGCAMAIPTGRHTTGRGLVTSGSLITPFGAKKISGLARASPRIGAAAAVAPSL